VLNHMENGEKQKLAQGKQATKKKEKLHLLS
jgi:hypothetical protein